MVHLNASLKDGYVVENNARDHQWSSDEPIEQGGDNLGPKPTELLLSSLASCMIITVKMYANRKEWQLDSIDVKLTIVETGEKTVIEKSIRFEGNLDEKQRTRLTVISGRCPVARMLANSIEFKTV